MRNRRGAKAYAHCAVESSAMSASPHQLISMLFEGLKSQMITSILCIEEGNIEGRSKAVSKCLDIVNNGLSAALDIEVGGEVAKNLDSVYAFVGRLLMEANRENSVSKIKKAMDIIDPIAQAWQEVGQRASVPS